MQPLARRAPERLTGLMFFDFVYPGVGARMGTPDRLNEIWYQSFHQMAMASGISRIARTRTGRRPRSHGSSAAWVRRAGRR